MAWVLREEGTHLETHDLYGTSVDFFTVKLHSGGEFVYMPKRHYIDGLVNYFDYCECDKMSMHEVDEMLKEFGYGHEVMFYYYRVPGMSLDNGLRGLGGDDDIRELIRVITEKKVNVVEIYVEHGSASVEEYFVPPPVTGSSVVIEEIDLCDEHPLGTQDDLDASYYENNKFTQLLLPPCETEHPNEEELHTVNSNSEHEHVNTDHNESGHGNES